MKIPILVFTIILINQMIYAQCYIQYTYDSSGNRTKREYVGNCAKPAPNTDQAEATLDSLQSATTQMRTELIRQDQEGLIFAFPNPAEDIIHITIDKLEPNWSYQVISMSGHTVRQSNISDTMIAIDIKDIPAAMYSCIIYDQGGQVVYKTKIIKK